MVACPAPSVTRTQAPGDRDRTPLGRIFTLMTRAILLAMCLAASFGAAARAQEEDATAAAEAAPSTSHAPSADGWSLAFVLLLSTLIGLGVIGRVSRLLHTPLMSLTNAISAIAVVGSIIVTGGNYPPGIRFMGGVALFASTANIVSGFLITDRMLKMFKQKGSGGKE